MVLALEHETTLANDAIAKLVQLATSQQLIRHDNLVMTTMTRCHRHDDMTSSSDRPKMSIFGRSDLVESPGSSTKSKMTISIEIVIFVIVDDDDDDDDVSSS